MGNWEKLEKCRVCGLFPLISSRGRRETELFCDHGDEEAAATRYKTTAEWNATQSTTGEGE